MFASFNGSAERHTRAGERAYARQLRAESDENLAQIAEAWEDSSLFYQIGRSFFGVSGEEQKAKAARTLLNLRDFIRDNTSGMDESKVTQRAYETAEQIHYRGRNPIDWLLPR